MPEIKHIVDCHIKNCYCDECYISPLVGNPIALLPRNICLAGDPSLYVYYCKTCDKEFNLDRQYPYYEFTIME